MRRKISALLTAVTTVAASGIVALVTMVANPQPALARENGLARTPPMGFNNWNFTHCNSTFNETTIKRVADAFVSLGLRDVGYQYVNIDGSTASPGF